MNGDLHRRLLNLTTPHLADACARLKIESPVRPSRNSGAGALRSCRWSGASCASQRKRCTVSGGHPGVLEGETYSLIDNEGRRDEACIGDLVALEASLAHLSGIIIWGLHRDTPELLQLGLPIFSMGSFPAGPRRPDRRSAGDLSSVQIGDWRIQGDIVAADAEVLIVK